MITIGGAPPLETFSPLRYTPSRSTPSRSTPMYAPLKSQSEGSTSLPSILQSLSPSGGAVKPLNR